MLSNRGLELILPLSLICVACPGKPDSNPPSDTGPGLIDADEDGYDASVDCDDGDPAVHPDADELCNGIDDDCDDGVDEDDAIDALTWYADGDGDGFGDPASETRACAAPSDHVDDSGDCDDGDPAVHPDAEELCNGTDDDCDDEVDEDGALDGTSWYADSDGDGHGDPDSVTTACAAPTDHVAEAGDCDDSDPLIHPDAIETCEDGLDSDCSGEDLACPQLGEFTASDATARLHGEASDDHAAWVASAGDVDDDGFDDILVGAMGNDHTDTRAGAAYLVSGPVTGDLDLATATARFYGEHQYNYAGSAVSGAGDLNGDGFDDVLIGVYGYHDTGTYFSGATFVLSGPVTGELGPASADAALFGEEDSEQLGLVLARAGDVNDDGFDDILLGAYRNDQRGQDAGATYLVLGPVSGEMGVLSADTRYLGENAHDWSGHSVAGAGDVDGDGLDDLLIGAPANDENGSLSGAAYVVPGSLSGDVDLGAADGRLFGDAREVEAGYAVAGVGDTNGDGYADVLVGAPYRDDVDDHHGAAHLVLGPVIGDHVLDSADATLVGEAEREEAGYAVAGAGDVDGNGVSDLLVGAHQGAAAGYRSGAAYLVLAPVRGTIGLDLADARIVGDTGGDELGKSVAGGGDVDGDSLADILIGADNNDEAGTCYLFTFASP